MTIRHTFKGVALMVAALLGSVAFTAEGVTQKEMEQARTITALWYLRYANDGSGYLEEGTVPTTMAQLEKKIKTDTERNNLKTFKNVAVPSDYAGWDKAKLVEYWGTTFFNSPGLVAKGKVARKRVQSKLSAMNVSAPAPAAEAKPEAAPAVPAGAEAAPAAPAEPAPASAPAAAAPAAAEVAPTGANPLPDAQEISSELAAAESAIAEETALTAPREHKGSGGTWIYIVALVILVGIVVWLVIFASKTMQQSERSGADEDNVDDEPEVLSAAAVRRKERPSAPASLPAPVRDKTTVNREMAELREECLRLGEENGRLESDLAQARREIEALKGRLRAASAAAASAASASVSAPASRPAESALAPAPPASASEGEREIYLGRVNQKGLFVRADRQPVADKTVFVLRTSDGYVGSFKVLQDAEVIGRCLDNPEHFLAGGCTAADILATDDASSIRTLQAGTASFQDGCWHIVRKTKISYE
ncbi:MAG: hypothetical protein HDR80_01345 [Bacteroides sp.]|nr:hypothetical protein [Bacteroides sp.]